MIINYEYYQIFYYVAENMNFTQAATQMFISQSTVSRSIQNLEHDLGCTLLIRSKHGISLTEEGKFLHEHLKKSFAFITIAENHLLNLKELTHGILRIGATELTLQHFLLPYIKSFETLYPSIHVDFDFEYPESAVRKLNSGLLDIALLTSPLKQSNSIQYHELAECEQTIIASSKYADKYPDPVDFSELSKESFILMKKGTSARSYAEQLFDSYNIACFPKHETGSTPLIISMVEANLGLGIVPRNFLTEKIASGSIHEIKTKRPLETFKIYALTSKTFQKNAVRDKFLAQLRAPYTSTIHLL
ncbi:MAG: LysR family transcriptional regulator [Agathobacter sp.]